LEIGLVVSIIDGVARAISLDFTFIGELIRIKSVSAVTINLEFLISGLSVLGNDREVLQGDIAERSFAELVIEVGFFIVGRIIDPIANFLDLTIKKIV
jgi:F-type H+/Na+-transporting ATPase subunit alpha